MADLQTFENGLFALETIRLIRDTGDKGKYVPRELVESASRQDLISCVDDLSTIGERVKSHQEILPLDKGAQGPLAKLKYYIEKSTGLVSCYRNTTGTTGEKLIQLHWIDIEDIFIEMQRNPEKVIAKFAQFEEHCTDFVSNGIAIPRTSKPLHVRVLLVLKDKYANMCNKAVVLYHVVKHCGDDIKPIQIATDAKIQKAVRFYFDKIRKTVKTCTAEDIRYSFRSDGRYKVAVYTKEVDRILYFGKVILSLSDQDFFIMETAF